jgi:HEAT repeat protein
VKSRSSNSLNSPNSSFCYDRKRALVRSSRFAFAVWAAALLCTLGCKTSSLFTRKTYSKPSIDSASAALASIRQSSDPAQRRAAFEYLGNPSHLGTEGREEISSILALALSSEQQAQTRIVILQSLARLGSPQRWEAFNAALRDKDPTVRVMACRLIARSGSTDQTEALDDLLNSDTSLDVRLAAADALSNIPTREAAMALLSGVQDSDVAVRHRCRQSLQNLTGKDHGGNADEWRTEIQTANFEQLPTHKGPFGFTW